MIYMIFLLIVFPFTVTAQSPEKPCSASEAHQFDFWLGDWNVEWKDADGGLGEGSNHVVRLFGNCVIEENFDGRPGTELIGKSFSVYDSKDKLWKQTWVDNNGTYLDFTGRFAEGKMILSRETVNPKGKSLIQRMVYYNIRQNSFEWDWQISYDNGKTWELKWRLNYSRK